MFSKFYNLIPFVSHTLILSYPPPPPPTPPQTQQRTLPCKGGMQVPGTINMPGQNGKSFLAGKLLTDPVASANYPKPNKMPPTSMQIWPDLTHITGPCAALIYMTVPHWRRGLQTYRSHTQMQQKWREMDPCPTPEIKLTCKTNTTHIKEIFSCSLHWQGHPVF